MYAQTIQTNAMKTGGGTRVSLKQTASDGVPLISTDLHESARRSEGVTSSWSEEERGRSIERYRKFLQLVAENPGRAVAPTRDIDEIWHLHMLSPVAYHRDCLAIFGRLLDHDGGFGKGEGELARLIEVFEDTEQRWQSRFGEPYRNDATEGATSCWHDCSGRCWHACSSIEGAVTS